jgi:cephalosporin hydroxylase
MPTSVSANSPDLFHAMAADPEVRQLRARTLEVMAKYRYAYNFNWLGRPIIQLPQDIVAVQELIWTIRPDLVIETGVAHGGSLILHASLLELLGRGEVLGIDIDIREHNRREIERHPLAKRIRLLQGSSIDREIAAQAMLVAADKAHVLVILDSNHTHDHVLAELRLYGPLVTRGSYLIVFDTAIEDMPASCFADRPWKPGDNPKTAVRAFLAENDRFEIDRELEARLLVTAAPDGYLRCIKD